MANRTSPPDPAREAFPIADALRLIRTRQGLTQTAASKRDGAPDFGAPVVPATSVTLPWCRPPRSRSSVTLPAPLLRRA